MKNGYKRASRKEIKNEWRAFNLAKINKLEGYVPIDYSYLKIESDISALRNMSKEDRFKEFDKITTNFNEYYETPELTLLDTIKYNMINSREGSIIEELGEEVGTVEDILTSNSNNQLYQKNKDGTISNIGDLLDDTNVPIYASEMDIYKDISDIFKPQLVMDDHGIGGGVLGIEISPMSCEENASDGDIYRIDKEKTKPKKKIIKRIAKKLRDGTVLIMLGTAAVGGWFLADVADGDWDGNPDLEKIVEIYSGEEHKPDAPARPDMWDWYRVEFSDSDGIHEFNADEGYFLADKNIDLGNLSIDVYKNNELEYDNLKILNTSEVQENGGPNKVLKVKFPANPLQWIVYDEDYDQINDTTSVKISFKNRNGEMQERNYNLLDGFYHRDFVRGGPIIRVSKFISNLKFGSMYGDGTYFSDNFTSLADSNATQQIFHKTNNGDKLIEERYTDLANVFSSDDFFNWPENGTFKIVTKGSIREGDEAYKHFGNEDIEYSVDFSVKKLKYAPGRIRTYFP